MSTMPFCLQATETADSKGREGQAEGKSRHKFLINPSCPTFSVLMICIWSGSDGVTVVLPAYMLVHFGSLTKLVLMTQQCLTFG